MVMRNSMRKKDSGAEQTDDVPLMLSLDGQGPHGICDRRMDLSHK